MRAHNAIGDSDWSEANLVGATIITKPHVMAMPTLGTDITLSRLEVIWQTLTGTSTGGASIDSYEVQYDANTLGITWTPLQGQDGSFALATSVIVNGLSGGLAYRFRVRAHNDMGWGDFSPEATFYTYDYPDAPTSVTTEYNNMNIKISWVAPATNYKPIT